MADALVVRDEIEAEVRAGYQAIAVENDAVVAPGAGNLGAVGAVVTQQHGFGGGAAVVAVGVGADEPAAVPFARGAGSGAAVCVGGDFLHDDVATAFDGFGAGKLQAGFQVAFHLSYPPALYQWLKAGQRNRQQHPQHAHGDHEFNQGKTQTMAWMEVLDAVHGVSFRGQDRDRG